VSFEVVSFEAVSFEAVSFEAVSFEVVSFWAVSFRGFFKMLLVFGVGGGCVACIARPRQKIVLWLNAKKNV
jgi:hypothetical protein